MGRQTKFEPGRIYGNVVLVATTDEHYAPERTYTIRCLYCGHQFDIAYGSMLRYVRDGKAGKLRCMLCAQIDRAINGRMDTAAFFAYFMPWYFYAYVLGFLPERWEKPSQFARDIIKLIKLGILGIPSRPVWLCEENLEDQLDIDNVVARPMTGSDAAAVNALKGDIRGQWIEVESEDGPTTLVDEAALRPGAHACGFVLMENRRGTVVVEHILSFSQAEIPRKDWLDMMVSQRVPASLVTNIKRPVADNVDYDEIRSEGARKVLSPLLADIEIAVAATSARTCVRRGRLTIPNTAWECFRRMAGRLEKEAVRYGLLDGPS